MPLNESWRYTPSLNQVLDRIRIIPGAPVVIGLSGYGGSGKTTLARDLGEGLPAPVVSIDEFGTGAVFGRSNDWHGFDRSRLVGQVLAPLASGAHEFWYDRCDDWDSWDTVVNHLVVERFLILEGVGLFHPVVLPYLNYCVWLDVPLAEATARGLAREQSQGRDQFEIWKSVWEPNERDFERRFHPKDRAQCLVRPFPD